jgi:hypothetical protein
VAACKRIVELFLSDQFVGKNLVTLCFFYATRLLLLFIFGGNHMLLQVNKMVKTLKTE